MKIIHILGMLLVALVVKAASPIEGLLERIDKGASRKFMIEQVKSPVDFFELDQKGDKVVIRGNNYVSIATGLNWYLKYPEKQTTVTPYVRGYYRTSFDLTPEELQNRRVLLNFDVVGYDAEVFLNGVKVGGHHGDFTPFRLDATEAAKPGKNVLAVRVLSDNGPTFGVQRKVAHTYGSQWAINNIKGGIWQDVTLSLEPQLRAERLTVTPDLASSSVSVDCRVVNPGSRPVTVSAAGRAVSAMKREAGAVAGETSLAGLTLKPGVNDFTLTVPLKNPRRWGVASPYLYDFLLTLAGEDGEIVSAASARFGFREFRIADGRFLLNGEPLFVHGSNWVPAEARSGFVSSPAFASINAPRLLKCPERISAGTVYPPSLPP